MSFWNNEIFFLGLGEIVAPVEASGLNELCDNGSCYFSC